MIGSFDKTPSFLPKECKEPARDAWLESQTSWEQVYLIIFRSSRINFNIFHYLGPFIYDPYCLVPTKLFRVVWVFERVCLFVAIYQKFISLTQDLLVLCIGLCL